MNDIPDQWALVYDQGFGPGVTSSKTIHPLDKLCSSVYGDVAWLDPFAHGTFTWDEYMVKRKNLRLVYSNKKNWPESPATVATLINYTLLNEHGAIDVPRFVERLNQEGAFGHKTLTWKIDVFLAGHHLANPKQPLSSEKAQAFLTTLAHNTPGRKHNLFECIRQIDHNMTWVPHVADMSPNADHHNWCLHKYMDMLDARDAYDIHANTGSGVNMMRHFAKADPQTIVAYGIKKKDPSVVTLGMLHNHVSIEKWARTIIDWIQPLGQNCTRSKEVYAHQVNRNILLGLEHMRPKQKTDLRNFLSENPDLSKCIQSAIALPSDNGEWRGWWIWNEALAKAGIVDFQTPNIEVQHQLNVLNDHLKSQVGTRREGSFSLGARDDVEPSWMSHQHPVLAKAAWEHTLQTSYRHVVLDTEHWEKLLKKDWSWLKNVSVASTLSDLDKYKLPLGEYGSQKHHLALITALLPKMNAQDRAFIAPISALVFGKNSVKSLSPQTFKNIWKALDKDYNRAIPRHYRGDTYMLYGLTGSDASALQGILESLDLKDSNTYLHITREWMKENTPELVSQKNKNAEPQIDASIF